MKSASYEPSIEKAIKSFGKTKRIQKKNSSDKSNRGAVLGGKQMDGFLSALKRIALEMGVPEECIYTKDTYLPGYFRSSKNWDFLIISPRGNLICVVELKSQVGSYGNNFNNRTEEVLGSALDLLTVLQKGKIRFASTPWLGYLIVVGRDEKSTKPIKNQVSHYSVLPEFSHASYLDRYAILCKKLVQERHYSSTALIWTSVDGAYGSMSYDTSIRAFINSFKGQIYGHLDEF